MKVKEIGIFLLIACMALFSACSDDDDKKEEPNLALEAVGAYKGDLSVLLGEEGEPIESTDVITVTSSKLNIIDLQLKDFAINIGGTLIPAGDINLKDLVLKAATNGTTIESSTQDITLTVLEIETPATITVTGTIVDKKIVLNLDITKVPGFELINVKFNGSKLKGDEKTGAVLTKLTFASELIFAEPVVAEGKTQIELFVVATAKAEDLKALTFTSVVSENAIVTPADGKLDLSTGSATITVVSEDGRTTTEYVVKQVISPKSSYDFNTWQIVIKNADPAKQVVLPAELEWASPEEKGLSMLMTLKYITYFPITESATDAHAGSAARLETLNSKGGKFGAIPLPKITPGSLYTGSFKTVPSNTLMSTKFGVRYPKKPLKLGGYYKYKAGPVFYRSSGIPKDCATAEPEVGTVDKGAISAVLYEIQEDTDDYITGVDTYTNDRIVATAMFLAGDVDAFTSFEVDFKYAEGKTYDKAKKYRLAIILSSSNDGSKFSGAPGSVLYVDDLEVISE